MAGKMSKLEYQRVLDHLGINTEEAAPVIGVSRRQSCRYASGDSRIADAVAKLLRVAIAHRLTAPDIQRF
jgi:predicted DNA-binding protein (UPF0251 family)